MSENFSFYSQMLLDHTCTSNPKEKNNLGTSSSDDSKLSVGKTDLLAKTDSAGSNAEGGVRKSGEGVGDNKRAEELFQKLSHEVSRLKELMGKKVDKLDK